MLKDLAPVFHSIKHSRDIELPTNQIKYIVRDSYMKGAKSKGLKHVPLLQRDACRKFIWIT